ncbi:MAG TPA: SWFGD domain-containing protein [Allosphingosinicella sp.]|nr:SWFGD domain-containing protein [Allosphingosinicella sp.]
MADNRYQQERGGSGRESIFSDDERGGSGRGRPGGEGEGRSRGDDRGFFDRAGDEVRSWLGDEEAQRRRERDGRYAGGGSDGPGEPWGGGDDAGRPSHYGREHGRGGFQGDYGGGSGQGGFGGQGDYRGGRRSFSGGSLSADFDDHYRSWRERQIAELDRDYEEYCRERQQQFESDFGSWRQSRQGRGGGESARSSGLSGNMSGTGSAGSTAGSATASGGLSGASAAEPAEAGGEARGGRGSS